MDTNSTKQTLWADTVVVSCPFFILLLMVPSTVILSNAEYFVVSFGEIMLPFAVIAVALMAISLTAFRFFPVLSTRLSPGFLLVSILLLLTSQIFTPFSTLVFDGNMGSIDTSSTAMYAELVIGASIIVVSWVASKTLFVQRAFISSILLIWSTANIALSDPNSTGQTVDASPVVEAEGTSDENVRGPIDLHAVASKNLNIFHIMTDSLQSDVFAEVLSENPEIREAFEGFVHFEDHGGYSNWTTMSLLSIFAKTPLFEINKAGDELYMEAIADLMANHSFVGELQEQGFYVTAVQPGYIFCKYTDYPCVQVGRFADQLQTYMNERGVVAPQHRTFLNLTMVHAQVADLALYRIFPAYWKNSVYNNGDWLISKTIDANTARFADMRQTEIEIQLSVETLRYLAEHISPTLDSPAYHFLHLYPPHRPFILDEECNFTDKLGVTGNAYSDGTEWSAYKMQSKCVLSLVSRFFGALRALDIYDSAIIVLQSDTGLGMVPQSDLGSGTAAIESNRITSLSPQQLAAYANPALAIKHRHATEPFTSSDTPTHHLDSFAMMMELASRIDNHIDLTTDSPFEFDASRTRQFVVSDAVREKTTTLPNQRFAITGKVKDISSWKDLGLFEHNQLHAYQPVSQIAVDYELEAPLNGSAPHVNFDVATIGGIEPLLYRVYELDSNHELHEARRYQPNKVFSVPVPEERFDPCKVEFTVIVRDTLSPKVELQQQVIVPLAYLSECH